MKPLFLILFFIVANAAFAQKAELEEISDKDLVKIMSNVEEFAVKEGSSLRVSLFTVSNGSGSAHLPESDEASHSIFIAVSEYGEDPQSHVFKTGPLILPKIVSSKDLGNTCSLSVELEAGRRQSCLYQQIK